MQTEAQNAPVVVRVQGLVKEFCDFWRRPKVRAVDGMDLEIRRGEVFGLLGPNGSGKSTTIKILLGLLEPTAGTVEVLGRSPRDIAAKARIGYLPEESYLYGYLTARETLEFYGRLFDLDARTRRERVEQLLAMTGLAEAADRAVGEFSKGMARRIGLAQALLNDPEVVILDEPTSGLDPVGCREVKDLMLTLARRGQTVVLSSHLLADVEDVCDRIAILYNGRIRALGSVREFLEESDAIRLRLPVLPPDTLKEVLAYLRERVGREPDVERPRMDLESFFLEVVRSVRPGADRGEGQVAAFLRAGSASGGAAESRR